MKRIIIFSLAVIVSVWAIVFFTKTTRAPQAPPNLKELTERIARLEALVAKLEKKSAISETPARPGTTTTFSPDGKTVVTRDGKVLRFAEGPQSSTQAGQVPAMSAPGRQVPPGWK